MTAIEPPVAVLFARRDSVYKQLAGVDVFDADRDARTFAGGMTVVAHPPCRAWGRLRTFARPAPGERELASWAVEQVRRWGGVLEHPASSRLWPECGLPAHGDRDAFGGWTLPIDQDWWGHRAEKRTRLYIVGVEPRDIPPFSLRLEEPERVIAQCRTRPDGTRIRKGDPEWRPETTKPEREHTPVRLAHWLCAVARLCDVETLERCA